jgi:hypothetical protein
LTPIELLSDVCDAVSPSLPDLSSSENTDDLKSFLKILDWRIRTTAAIATPGRNGIDTPLVMELYRLAMLVYLNRVCEKLLNQRARTQEQVEKAFTILAQLPSCDRQFPVFILGCEARSDHQRAVLLDLISRTENGVFSRSFNHVRLLLQAVWAQEDLAEGNIQYLDKLSHVSSCCRILPSFV